MNNKLKNTTTKAKRNIKTFAIKHSITIGGVACIGSLIASVVISKKINDDIKKADREDKARILGNAYGTGYIIGMYAALGEARTNGIAITDDEANLIMNNSVNSFQVENETIDIHAISDAVIEVRHQNGWELPEGE